MHGTLFGLGPFLKMEAMRSVILINGLKTLLKSSVDADIQKVKIKKKYIHMYLVFIQNRLSSFHLHFLILKTYA